MKHLIRVEHFCVENFLVGKLFPFLIVILFSTPSYGQTISGNLVVPVVFHIISKNPDSISDQQIVNEVADLNDAFAHTGPYATGGPGVNTGIRFCLAKVDPGGANTSGITRTQSVLGDFDSDIENDRIKNLVSWNTKEYCNIWLVDGVENEYLIKFSCGNWSSRYDIGYGTFDSSGDYRDGIVTKDLGSALAALMGSYLGLKYTFVQGSCANTNCNTDGDGICDTPPASIPGSSCTAIQNSCSSDTLSGFTRDMPDLTSNFMSLSGACVNSFTAGQAAKMRTDLNTVRNILISNNKCNAPCPENIVASFTRDNWFPKIGDQINFTSTSTGASNYQWSVNGVVVGSNSPTYSMVFTTAGKTQVSLKVYNANANCYARYSDSIIVSCGVMARFTPNVRQIASKESILLDSILFSNRSVNATSFQWWMSNDKGMAPQIISTSNNLNYTFNSPGNYSVWLIAANGSCSDTSGKFNFPVYDPTVDGTVSFNNVECYQQTKIMVSINVCNSGYASVPAGTPISFYDADPRKGSANRLSPVLFTTNPVAGKCCSSYTTIIDVHKPGLNQLYAVFNDNGNSSPFSLPDTKLVESSYTNNVDSQSNFQFHVVSIPDSATLQPGDSLLLSAKAGPGIVSSYVWSTGQDLNCTQCDSSYFIAENKVYSITKKMVATSSYACVDSSLTIINIPPADDFQIVMDSLVCAGEDSLHAAFTICNNFKRGNIPKGLGVSFYDADPGQPGAILLGPVFSTPDGNAATCATYQSFFKRTTTGMVIADVNDNGQGSAVFEESRSDNNKDTISLIPFIVTINPSDTTVSRLTSIRLNPQISGGLASTYKWEPIQYLSCSDCPSPVSTPAAGIEYKLTIQNEYACPATGTTSIKTFAGGSVSIPNAFTPNNDGHNDVFYILGGENVKMLKDFSIFNRWGQRVFQVTDAEANDPRFGWNGLLNGKPADPATYVYFVTVAFEDGTTELFKGTVILIR